MPELCVVLMLISVLLAFESVVGRTHYPRIQGQCDIQVITVYLPQVN